MSLRAGNGHGNHERYRAIIYSSRFDNAQLFKTVLSYLTKQNQTKVLSE